MTQCCESSDWLIRFSVAQSSNRKKKKKKKRKENENVARATIQDEPDEESLDVSDRRNNRIVLKSIPPTNLRASQIFENFRLEGGRNS